MIEKFPKHIVTPSILAETDQFLIKFAENREEIKKALRLRYEIFNIEQGKGLKSAKEHGIDEDEFDEYCLHLLVIEKKSGHAVGTYRIHLGSVASSARGFYSSREFEIEGLDKIAAGSVEFGRSCVSSKFRTGVGVALLWGGIAELLSRVNLKYMLGCVSLEETDSAIGWALYKYFYKIGRISDKLIARPLKEFVLQYPDEDKIEKLLSNEKGLKRYIPPLFRGYLRVGSNICGEPAFDHEFGTIDFLILVERKNVPERYMRHFNFDLELD